MNLEELKIGEFYRFKGFTDFIIQYDGMKDENTIKTKYAISVLDKEVLTGCTLPIVSRFFRGIDPLEPHLKEWAKGKIDYKLKNEKK